MQMLVDGFTFYNELDMLEYRLTVLDEIVDYFVLVEATRTHAGNPKLLYYSMNKERYAKWNHKIIHIVVDLKSNKSWHNEHTQRRAIDQGFEQLNLKDNDIIMVSDVDEIPDINLLRAYLSMPDPKKDILLQQNVHVYSIENIAGMCTSTKVVPYKIYGDKYRYDCEFVRMWSAINHQEQQLVAANGGWHLTYFGDKNFVHNKLANFAHQEFNNEYFNTKDIIEEKIKTHKSLQGKDLQVVPVSENQYLPPRMDVFLRLFPISKK